MNWTALAILVTVTIAQAGLVVGLLDRLFRAEIKLISQAIEGMLSRIEKNDAREILRDKAMEDLSHRLVRMEEWKRGIVRAEVLAAPSDNKY